MKKGVRFFWLLAGLISLGLGTIGVFLPILPTVPFYLLTLFAFTRSSERLYNWFIVTNLYREHLESFVQKKSMKKKTKIRIILTVTIVMAIGFIMMSKVLIGRICLAMVWVCHILYFVFYIKTEKEEEQASD